MEYRQSKLVVFCFHLHSWDGWDGSRQSGGISERQLELCC